MKLDLQDAFVVEGVVRDPREYRTISDRLKYVFLRNSLVGSLRNVVRWPYDVLTGDFTGFTDGIVRGNTVFQCETVLKTPILRGLRKLYVKNGRYHYT